MFSEIYPITFRAVKKSLPLCKGRWHGNAVTEGL